MALRLAFLTGSFPVRSTPKCLVRHANYSSIQVEHLTEGKKHFLVNPVWFTDWNDGLCQAIHPVLGTKEIPKEVFF